MRRALSVFLILVSSFGFVYARKYPERVPRFRMPVEETETELFSQNTDYIFLTETDTEKDSETVASEKEAETKIKSKAEIEAEKEAQKADRAQRKAERKAKRKERKYKQVEATVNYTFDSMEPAKADAATFSFGIYNGYKIEDNQIVYAITSVGYTAPFNQRILFGEVPSSFDLMFGLGYKFKYKSFAISADADLLVKDVLSELSDGINFYSMAGFRTTFYYDFFKNNKKNYKDFSVGIPFSMFFSDSGWRLSSGISFQILTKRSAKTPLYTKPPVEF